MQPDSTNYNEWMEKAKNDLRAARAILEYYDDPPTDTVCYHCHQVGEKGLKAFLLKNAGELPHIHDLVGLLNQCIKLDASLEALKKKILILNQYFVEAKYPLDDPIRYSKKEAAEAYQLASLVLETIKGKLE